MKKEKHIQEVQRKDSVCFRVMIKVNGNLQES